MMDAVSIRKKYGERLFLVGNLDKVELAKGGEAMTKEVDSKAPILKEMGGYTPGADHRIPAEFPLQRFNEYAEHIKRLAVLMRSHEDFIVLFEDRNASSRAGMRCEFYPNPAAKRGLNTSAKVGLAYDNQD